MSKSYQNKLDKIKRVYRNLNCAICPPNRGCNAKQGCVKNRRAKPKGKKPSRHKECFVDSNDYDGIVMLSDGSVEHFREE